MKESNDDFSNTDLHINRLTKKYIIDILNALMFSKTVLWDGVDQFNELPIFKASVEDGLRVEQRGALFVNKKTNKAVRIVITAQESTVQKICYRITSLKEAIRIDDGKRLFYPFESIVLDMSAADLNLGMKDPAAYSFSDNTTPHKETSTKRLFSLLEHLLNSKFIVIEDENIFKDLIDSIPSLPPLPDDAHFKLVFASKEII